LALDWVVSALAESRVAVATSEADEIDALAEQMRVTTELAAARARLSVEP
jgi:hypothetical protein